MKCWPRRRGFLRLSADSTDALRQLEHGLGREQRDGNRDPRRQHRGAEHAPPPVAPPPEHERPRGSDHRDCAAAPRPQRRQIRIDVIGGQQNKNDADVLPHAPPTAATTQRQKEPPSARSPSDRRRLESNMDGTPSVCAMRLDVAFQLGGRVLKPPLGPRRKRPAAPRRCLRGRGSLRVRD